MPAGKSGTADYEETAGQGRCKMRNLNSKLSASLPGWLRRGMKNADIGVL